jgi:hypothetical protein
MANEVVQIIGAAELELKLDDVAMALVRNSKLMGVLGNFVNTSIKARTSEGVSAEGSPFDPYSVRYAKWRKNVAKMPVDKVDLTLTGGMFIALTYTAQDDRVTSFFMDTPDKRNPKVRNPAKAFFNQQLRNFFSISAGEVKEIEAMIKEYVDRHLRSDKRGTQ